MRHLILIVLAASVSMFAACSGLTAFNQAINNTNEALNTTNEALETADEAAETTEKVADAAQPDGLEGQNNGSSGGSATTASSNPSSDPIRCCVNQQYYTCNSAGAAAECVGEPFDMMNCVQNCGFGDSSCEQSCINRHGPNPSQCTREAHRDAECPKN